MDEKSMKDFVRYWGNDWIKAYSILHFNYKNKGGNLNGCNIAEQDKAGDGKKRN